MNMKMKTKMKDEEEQEVEEGAKKQHCRPAIIVRRQEVRTEFKIIKIIK